MTGFALLRIMILAGDIGGTHTRIALYHNKQLHGEREYQSRSHPNLEEIVADFLRHEKTKVSAASFGIAGAVRNGVCKATNLAWNVDAARLRRELKLEKVHVINDLMANAYGLFVLEKKDLFELQPGDPELMGNRALISAGTGLGEAGLYWDGKRHHPFACEGGHADFAPRNEAEVELFFYLQKKYGHVSYERVVSGPGLFSIYQFLIDSGREEASSEVEEEMKRGDPSVVIGLWGEKKRDPACKRALQWFISLYGAEAGNWALKMLPFGGLFIGGGIAPHLVASFQEGEFLNSFRNKGRFDSLLDSIPIWIILNSHAALFGAGAYAERVDES